MVPSDVPKYGSKVAMLRGSIEELDAGRKEGKTTLRKKNNDKLFQIINF